MIITLFIAKLTAFILRLMKRGATTLPGRIALKLKYNILTKLSKDVKIICVTGTNGKTTTCALIEHALKTERHSYFINKSGANMLSGVTTSFIMNSKITGKCKKEIAILECDENSLPLISRYIDADAIVVTNIFRDQLDRYGEVSATLNAIKRGIENMPRALLIINADDPLSSSLIKTCKNRAVTFGIKAELKAPELSDSRYCPFCKTELKYKSHTISQLGNFYCPRCSFRRLTPDYEISEITNTGFLINNQLSATALGGLYNLYNFCSAAAVINELNLGKTDSLRSFKGAFGRMEKFTNNGKTALLLLVKNPTGLTGCIRYVCSIKGGLDAAFALNDNDADGRDISWIWDSDFTSLKSKCKNVYTVGTRSLDMALRLKYDEINATEIIDGEDYKRLISLIKESDNDFIIFSTYTAMMKMRHQFISAFGGKEFWE